MTQTRENGHIGTLLLLSPIVVVGRNCIGNNTTKIYTSSRIIKMSTVLSIILAIFLYITIRRSMTPCSIYTPFPILNCTIWCAAIQQETKILSKGETLSLGSFQRNMEVFHFIASSSLHADNSIYNKRRSKKIFFSSSSVPLGYQIYLPWRHTHLK